MTRGNKLFLTWHMMSFTQFMCYSGWDDISTPWTIFTFYIIILMIWCSRTLSVYMHPHCWLFYLYFVEDIKNISSHVFLFMIKIVDFSPLYFLSENCTLNFKKGERLMQLNKSFLDVLSNQTNMCFFGKVFSSYIFSLVY